MLCQWENVKLDDPKAFLDLYINTNVDKVIKL